jgi:ComF family protein
MVFPSICLLCGASPGRRPGQNLCLGCETDLPWITSPCRTCGLPLPAAAHQLQCGECLSSPPPFTFAMTPLLYCPPVSRLLTGFKHRRQLVQGALLGQLLARELRDHYLLCGGNQQDARMLMPELILPVPLHWSRWLWRGYNQSAELGKQLAKELQVPCRTDLLRRVRRTASQQGLSREQRLHNLKDAFQLARPLHCERVALLDDVVTTGSTAREIAGLLLQQGVKEIHLWAVARTPP